jgi:uncharacterized protein
MLSLWNLQWVLPIQCGVGINNPFLRALPDLVFSAIGLAAQLFVGRSLRIRPKVNYALALAALILSLSHPGAFPRPIRHLIPAPLRTDFVPDMVLLWWCFLDAVSVILLLRDRVPAKFRSERRAFLTASTAALCAAPAACLAGGVILRKDFQITEIDIAFPNLPKDLQGLRLLQLSDIHIGDFFSERDVARVVDASNHLRPDLAFITGDLITNKRDPLDRCLLQLSRLRSSSGTWGCMGNHELYAKVQNRTKTKAQALGMYFLRGEAAPLKFGNSRINLVGVDYQRQGEPYLEEVDDLVSRDSFNLLLCHNPDVFPVAARKGFDLTLAGHTHGGQINLEILGANLNMADFFTPYTKGLYTLPNSRIYVNSGLGTIGMPVRIGAPPEITLIRLCST